MVNNRRDPIYVRRHSKFVKRQDLDPASSTGDGGLGILPTPSEQPSSSQPQSPSLSIPTLSPPSDTTIAVISNPSASTTDHSTNRSPSPLPSTSLTSSLPTSISSSSTSVASSSLASATPFSSPASSSPSQASDTLSSLTDVTSIITSMSGAIPVTVTTIIGPSASLSSEPQSTTTFFQNKAESGAVFAVVGLVALAGFGFLGFRFYKTIKERRADRETEDAARAAAKVRVRLDDDDDDRYDGSSHAHGMVQYHNGPPVITGGFDFHANDGLGIGNSEESHSAESASHYPVGGPHYVTSLPQLSQKNGPPYLQTTFNGVDLTDAGHSAPPRRSDESGEHLLLTSSSSGTSTQHPTRSNTTSSRSDFDTLSSAVSRSQSSQVPHKPPPPTLPLPEAFGEGEPSRQSQFLEDNEYYNGTIGRVLKIANE